MITLEPTAGDNFSNYNGVYLPWDISNFTLPH
jgi:hypothetical protein